MVKIINLVWARLFMHGKNTLYLLFILSEQLLVASFGTNSLPFKSFINLNLAALKWKLSVDILLMINILCRNNVSLNLYKVVMVTPRITNTVISLVTISSKRRTPKHTTQPRDCIIFILSRGFQRSQTSLAYKTLILEGIYFRKISCQTSQQLGRSFRGVLYL